MKQTILLLFLIASLKLGAVEVDSTNYNIHVVDYSLSWTSSTHFWFDEDEVKVYEVDNVDEKDITVLIHRQLFGKEKDRIRTYLSIFTTIGLGDQYIERKYAERNQKRFTIKYGDKEQKIFVSNTYQQDIAAFVIFLNSFIPEKGRMKEFHNPNAPVKKKE